MEALIVVLLLVLIAIVAGVAAYGLLLRGNQEQPKNLEPEEFANALANLKSDLTQAVDNSGRTLLEQINAVETRVNQRFDGVQGTVSKSMDGTHQTIKEVNERLGHLSASTRQMLEIGQNISSLQEILRPPKLRGGFGELQLERILADCGLPADSYKMQHRFPSGVQVDAVIMIGGGMVPIDSKFPLEGFNRVMETQEPAERAKVRRSFLRDVQKHVDAVEKYILPDEGTFDFVLMFIPAEGVYYETFFGDDELTDDASVWMYAMKKRVIPVSPSNFYAYLYALVLGLRGLQVDKQAREIINHVTQLSGDFNRIQDDFGTLGRHLKNASDRYVDVDRAFTKYGDRLAITLNEPIQAELPSSDQPDLPGAESAEPAIPGSLRADGSEDS